MMFPYQYSKDPGFVSGHAIDLMQNAAALLASKVLEVEAYSRDKVWNDT